jgi:hypothetical protein
VSAWLVYDAATGVVLKYVTGARRPAPREGQGVTTLDPATDRAVRLGRPHFFRVDPLTGVVAPKALVTLTVDRRRIVADGADHARVSHDQAGPVTLWVAGLEVIASPAVEVTSSLPRQVLVRVAPSDPACYTDDTRDDGEPGAPVVISAEEPT